MQEFIGYNLTVVILFAFACAGFASTRHRNPVGWAVLGLIFGAVGVLVLLAIPPGRPPLDVPVDGR